MKKKILITGTSRGVGLYLANMLGIENKIIGISREKTSTSLYKEFNINLTDCEKLDKIVKNFEQENIIFDVIIFNAGVGYFGEYFSGNIGEYENILKLNLENPIIFLHKLKNQIHKNTKIIFIGSIISKKFMKGASVYQASKFGLRGFAGGLNKELHGNRVHIINPKIIDTHFHDDSQIDISPDFPRTEMRDIYQVLQNIILGTEQRFEIDL